VVFVLQCLTLKFLIQLLLALVLTKVGISIESMLKKDIPKGCNIILLAQKESRPTIAKKSESNICKSLLIPLTVYINTSNVIYAQYVKGYKFEDAKKLYNLDKKMNLDSRVTDPTLLS
jgi:hypothetical protein